MPRPAAWPDSLTKRSFLSTMKLCPICGVELRPRVVYEVVVDACPKCGGVWLDGGELQKLIAKIGEYREEYYSDERYREWEEEWREKKKKKGIFDLFDEIFD